MMRPAAALALAALGVMTGAAACSKPAPPPTTTAAAPDAKRYPMSGQIISVNDTKQSLTIKHGDIPGYMPAMTMTFQVARPDLMQTREAGELIVATLEVTPSAGQLVEITRTGTAPLPDPKQSGSLAANVLDIGETVPDTALIDQNNARRAFNEWHGTPTLITFIYTRCPLPNFCPLMDRNFVAIQKQGAADPTLKNKFKLVSVSFDPEHDSPAVLKAHAKTLGADETQWSFLTADAVTIERFAARFGVGVVRDGDASGTITHNLRTALLGADGKILKIYGGSDWSVSTVLADLRAAVTAAAK